MIDLAAAASLAAAAGLRLRIVPLGDWGRVRLFAEYDAAARCVNVDANALRHLLETKGEECAARFLERAVRHELFHARNPLATEAAARAAGDA